MQGEKKVQVDKKDPRTIKREQQASSVAGRGRRDQKSNLRVDIAGIKNVVNEDSYSKQMTATDR